MPRGTRLPTVGTPHSRVRGTVVTAVSSVPILGRSQSELQSIVESKIRVLLPVSSGLQSSKGLLK